MSKTALAERIGTVLKLAETDAPAEIVRSYRVAEEFPADPNIAVIFDFARQADGKMIVHLSRITGGKARRKGTWELSAIEDRDSKGLEGFKEFAESLDLKGAQLAKIIDGFKPLD